MFLTRAQRWCVVVLIDEADVYIKRRVDDIDKAIVLRCIAMIRFSTPYGDARSIPNGF